MASKIGIGSARRSSVCREPADDARETRRRVYKPDHIGMSSPRTMIGLTLLANLVGSMIGLSVAQAAAQTAPHFKVGVATRALVPAEPHEWRGDAKHALATLVWYPAETGVEEKPQS